MLARTLDSARAIVRRTGVGRALLRAKRAYQFGLRVEINTFLGRRRYLKAIERLRPMDSGAGTLGCFMLLNKARFLEGVWSLYSFRYFFGQCRSIVLNDGTLTFDNVAFLKRLFPGIYVPDFEANNRQIDAYLEQAGLARCREWRRKFVLFRKLVDPVCLAPSDKVLMLDSDVLHFRAPDEVRAWSERPDALLYMADTNCNPHCASSEELEDICGAPLPTHFNSGYLAIPPGAIDLGRVEHYLAADRFERQRVSGRFSYVAEQTLYAMEGAKSGARVLPKTYAICPDPKIDKAVMGHFCGGAASRTWFHTKGLPLLSRELSMAEGQ